MNQIKADTHSTPSLAARFAALAVKAAPWRRSAGLATLAIILGGIVSTAQAKLLVYEPFEYTPGQNLNGQSGGADAVGMIGVWKAASDSTTLFAGTNGVQVIAPNLSPGPLWKGICTSVPQKGVYAGSPATPGYNGQNGNTPNIMWASRPLDPNIVTNFTLGSTNWMSCVQMQNFTNNFNYCAMTFSIGAGVFDGTYATGDVSSGRGTQVNGGAAVGLGLQFPATSGAIPKYLIAGIWDNNVSSTYYQEENGLGSTGILVETPGNRLPPLWINIVQIVWGDVNNPTTVTMASFPDGTPLSEAAFDQYVSTNLQTVTSTYNVDPTTFTNISLGGGRFNCDELRIGTTFDDVVGLVPGAPGIYWAPTGQGGSGMWGSGTNNWAQIPNVVGVLPQSMTNTLIFAGTNGTVTVNGTVTTGAGLQFSVNGYSLVPGSSTPQISLAGANAAANIITVNTGTNTIGVQLSGTAGMTKAGLGTLNLTNTSNAYAGGTVLSAGSLRFATLGSLGSGNVTFGGGALQYPPGSGTATMDVSPLINPVASGQAAAIDTDGYDVTFGTAISGAGGLTKLGSGSLTLGVANTYTGPTTVSGGTLNVSSASGVIATLNVLAGGTVNLGAGAVVNALNITGGTVNLTGAGVQVGTLLGTAGTLNASTYSLTVTNNAGLNGVTFTLGGASSFTLSGADVINPTAANHRIITATGGTLSFATTGLDVAIGQGAPLTPASAATGHFYGSGVWDLVNGVATDINNTYGKDNHAFHYIALPSGDFDIKCRVTGVTNASAGLMVRDNLVSEWDSHTGNYIGVYTDLGNSVTAVYATIQSSATHAGWINSIGVNQGAVTPWLEITKVGSLVTTYCSVDGTDGSYVQVQQVDYSASSWGPTMYLGLDLINTTGPGSGAFDNVNFMGSVGNADISTTEFALYGGAQMNLGPTMTVAKVSTNSIALANGCWAGSAITGANHIDPTIFTSTGTGIAVISSLGPLTLTTPDITVTASDPYSYVVVNYPPLVVAGGTPPYTATNYVPPSGSSYLLGTNVVTVTVTDSSCPSAHTAYSSFRVIVAPPAPVLNPSTGFKIVGGNPTFTFATFTSMYYRLVYTSNLANPASAWLPVVNLAGIPPTDANGWVFADGTSMTLTDPSGLSASRRFYRIVVSPTAQ